MDAARLARSNAHDMINIFSRVTIDAEAAKAGVEYRSSILPALALAKEMTTEQLLKLIERSGLTGKGGANFPMYRKVALMQKQVSGEKHLVVNGGEHEPGSEKDRYLLETYPETIIEGALILAFAVNANAIHVAVKKSAADAVAMINLAIERAAVSYRMTRGGNPLSVSVVEVPDSYIVGEESALIAALEGQPALPRGRPPFPIESGLHSKPTIVHNVESVGHLPYIVVAGADRYRSLSAYGLGVTLCTFGPEFKHCGVRLVPLGIPLREVVYRYGGGLGSDEIIRAVQPGGPAAGILSESELGVPFEDRALKLVGSTLGCGAIRAFSRTDDIVSYVAEIMSFFADSTCGQCPACRMETQMLASIMAQVMAKRATEKLLRQVPVIVKNATSKPALCSFVHMPAAMILSALKRFPEEFDRYLAA
jgi:NADH:ubiquinone oxidoreductase subunit F (NADH-binding)